MAEFEQIADSVYRLFVPFEGIATSVFLIRTENGDTVLDTATTPADVRDCILPALKVFGAAVRRIIVSHPHGDHAGGLPALAAALPQAQIAMLELKPIAGYPNHRLLSDGERLDGCLRVLNLPGHTAHSLGILDERSGTLLTFDSLQLCGVSRWGTGLSLPSRYLGSLERLRMLNFTRIVAAHEYVPLGSVAEGRAAVDRYLAECAADVRRIRDYLFRHTGESPEELAAGFNRAHPGHPPIGPRTVKAFLENK